MFGLVTQNKGNAIYWIRTKDLQKERYFVTLFFIEVEPAN